MEEQADQKG